MRYTKGRNTRKKRWILFGIRFAFLILLIGVGTELLFGQAVRRTLSYQGKRAAISAMSDAILPFLEDPDYTYDQLSNVSYDDNGNILSISLNTTKLNQMKTKMEKQVTQALTGAGSAVSVPLGTLLGLTLFSQRGPDITLHTAVYGVVQSEYQSDFKSAGINQTEHTISIILTATLETFIPFFSQSFTLEQEFLIAQTILVGEVPDQLLSLKE